MEGEKKITRESRESINIPWFSTALSSVHPWSLRIKHCRIHEKGVKNIQTNLFSILDKQVKEKTIMVQCQRMGETDENRILDTP